MKLDKYLTYQEAGKILVLRQDTIRQYCKLGRLDRVYTMGQRAPFVTRASVQRYKAERRGYERRGEATNESGVGDGWAN